MAGKGDLAKEGVEQVVKGADDVVEVGAKGVKAAKGFISSLLGKGKKAVLPARTDAGDLKFWKNVGKYGVVPGVLGLGGYVGYNALKPQAPGESLDWTTISGFGNNAISKEDAINKFIEAASSGGGGGGGVPRPADLKKQYEKLTGISDLTRGASYAAIQRLANQAAAASTNIRAGGEAAGRSVQDIYGAAAAQAAENAKLAGTEGSSLTPVSGLAATLPAELRASGATLSDYLTKNQLISAQDAGFLSQLAAQQAPAYDAQISRQNELFLMADIARRNAEYQRQVAAANASRSSAQNEARMLGLKLKLEQDLKNSTTVPLEQINPKAVEDEWNKIKKDKRMLGFYGAQNIKNLQQFAQYKVDQLRSYQEQ